MRRIRIPDHFITIIENSFKYRTNQVITDVGLTNKYNMNNGIDQGEIMSPLLWIIYYNPLFIKIKNKGYRLYNGTLLEKRFIITYDGNAHIGNI